MKIIILGAGQVGSTLAENLATENNDVTVIDKNLDRLQALQEQLDLRCVQGNAAHPNILSKGGVEDAEMLIAATNSDETNMIACQIAYTLYQTPTKIARVRSLQYLAHEELFGTNAIPIDVLISPEQLVTKHIHSVILHPDALQVLNFANHKLQMVAIKAQKEGPLVGQALKAIHQHMPQTDARVVAIYRDDSAIIPEGNTVIQENDEVFFLAARENIRIIMGELRELEPTYKRIIIGGGGNIGTRLAQSLEHDFHVKIIEHNSERLQLLASHLNKAIVLHGEVADKQLLLNENIEDTDVFCAVTNRDETNILAALMAKRLGARKVMALINRPAYAELVEGGDIDIAISPQQTTVGSLLTHIRRGDVVNVYSLRRGVAEAIEAIAHGQRETSQVVGKRIDEIHLPPDAIIGAVVRKGQVMMGHHDLVIEENDHVILFLTDKRKVPEIERLFQPINTL